MLYHSVLAVIGLLAAQSAAASVKRFDSLAPFWDHDANTPADCTLWWNSDDGLSCDTALLIVGISANQLTLMNPSIESCADWKVDYSYCIDTASGIPEPVPDPTPTPDPVTTSAPPVTTTTPDNGVTTPEPVQPGMVDNCNSFYKVQSGDTCEVIASKAGVTVAQLAAWNTKIGGTACTTIWVDFHICTGVIGGSPTEPEPVDPTPQPVQPGMVDNCNRFYKVQSGDTCETIASKAGVTISQLAAWNTKIGGTACTTIWADFYICTGVSGGSPTEPPPANSTPQPIQDGMVDNCNRWHLVGSGDTCETIAAKTGVTVAQLAKWNTKIGGVACTGMWSGYYLCTGVTGGSPTEPPPTNSTPQPVQDGMVANCKKFHLVQSGHTCEVIAAMYGITVANFIKWNPAAKSGCTGLWAETYACVGL